MEKLNLISVIFAAVLAIIVFVPVLVLLLLPFVKHAEKKKGLMWLAGIAAFLLNLGLVISWAGDIIQNRAGDLSIIAFCAYCVVYAVAPFFYLAFFKRGKAAEVYPVIIAVMMALCGVALILVPVFYGINTGFGVLTRILGCAGLIVPQLYNALFYIFLSRRAAAYTDDSDKPANTDD